MTGAHTTPEGVGGIPPGVPKPATVGIGAAIPDRSGLPARGTRSDRRTHGTASTYNGGRCRCRPCTDAHAAEMRDYRRRRREAGGGPLRAVRRVTYVDGLPVYTREHWRGCV